MFGGNDVFRQQIRTCMQSCLVNQPLKVPLPEIRPYDQGLVNHWFSSIRRLIKPLIFWNQIFTSIPKPMNFSEHLQDQWDDCNMYDYMKTVSRWWFSNSFFNFTPIWGNDPIWLWFIFSNVLKPPSSMLVSAWNPLIKKQPFIDGKIYNHPMNPIWAK